MTRRMGAWWTGRLLGKMPQPVEEPGEHLSKLLRAEIPQLADGSHWRIGGHILDQKCTRFQKGGTYRDLILGAAETGRVRHNRDNALSRSLKARLTIRTGRTFSAMPRSNSQISPRAGVILFGVQHHHQLVSRMGGLFIIEWA